MFEGQPKGLYALALANTGERFGYYTMLAIFVLFLKSKLWSIARYGRYDLLHIPCFSLFFTIHRRYLS